MKKAGRAPASECGNQGEPEHHPALKTLARIRILRASVKLAAAGEWRGVDSRRTKKQGRE
jgi:hypothetical protein